MNEMKIVKTPELQDFVVKILRQNSLEKRQAEITADVLVCADRRGINSHGVARLKRYIDGLKDGTIRLNPNVRIVKETPVSLVIDGDGGMGQPIAFDAMTKCIEKAKHSFICFASIRNSNHYGIAGYYTLMALKENLIGISLTNTAPLVVPTFGKEVAIGTNPISIGIPAKDDKPFLLDMATSTVPRGKIEVYARKEAEIPDC
ncbi:MAG: Ldh family oxidoreductase [Candidatus Marinimicrobia bacterium]|nr:Ldh family oxidoreductase [Candidatus Neomarinimicrobiota bacterium]